MTVETVAADADTVPAPTVRAVLARAWRRIEDPAEWLPGPLSAERADGTACEPWDPAAVRWCAWGALYASWPAVRVQPDGVTAWDRAREAIWQAAADLYHGDPSAVNDTRGHDAVRRVFARARELLG